MNIREIRKHNNNLLLRYCAEGKCRLVAELVWMHIHEQTVEINCVRDCDFSTPLHLAVESGHLAIVHLLIESGSHIDQKRLDGQTPLDIALNKNNELIAELLLRECTATASFFLPTQRNMMLE